MFNLDHPFFLPVWRRYLTVAACTLWTGVELWVGEPFWAVIAGGFAAYTLWALVLRFDEAAVRAMAEAQKKP